MGIFCRVLFQMYLNLWFCFVSFAFLPYRQRKEHTVCSDKGLLHSEKGFILFIHFFYLFFMGALELGGIETGLG